MPLAVRDTVLSFDIRRSEMNQTSALQQVLADLRPKIGQEIHCSDWLEVTQQRIDEFAQATGDHQWIHTDAARALRESPWRTTIAHGYLTLSLYPLLRGLVDADKPLFAGVTRVINYGLDKLRFPNAVKSREPRARALRAAEDRGSAGRPAAGRAVHGRDRGRSEAGLRRRRHHAGVFLTVAVVAARDERRGGRGPGGGSRGRRDRMDPAAEPQHGSRVPASLRPAPRPAIASRARRPPRGARHDRSGPTTARHRFCRDSRAE